ncbi:MAG: winged helix-turn-helix domain-containing protein [Acidobacteria bacterium]|nr:winged helix-turn-helix domain-containing protein [Acidobacteriota bacterium]
MPQLRLGAEHEEFYELFSANVMGLGPYEREDALGLLQRVAGRYGVGLPVETSERLIGLTGGHPGLLKAACLALVKGQVSLPESDEQALAGLLQVDDVRTECGKLWDGLGEDERTVLRDLVIKRKAAPGNAEAGRRLRLKHLVKEENQITRPFGVLFTEYIAAQKASAAHSTKTQAGPIRIDTAGEVWVGGQQMVPPLTRKELLLLEYLCLEPGRLRTKDEIVAVVYPDEYQRGNSPTDDALHAMIKRLRIRLEQSGLPSNCITTLRGKGYRLEIG